MKLGKVLHISPSTGNIIVRSQTVPRIGQKVFNGELRQVGVVFDVIGPVSSPYVSVKPTIQDPSKIVNHTLFQELKKK